MWSSPKPASALIAALTAALLIASPAFASINYNASKSNTGNFTFSPGNSAGLKKCAALHGKAVKQTGGKTLCVVPPKPQTTGGK
jgi:hypothetical protein